MMRFWFKKYFILLILFCTSNFLYFYILNFNFLNTSNYLIQVYDYRLNPNVNYHDIIEKFTFFPPLLSLVRKLNIHTGLNFNLIFLAFLYLISSICLFNFINERYKSKIILWFCIIFYFFCPSLFQLVYYEYDIGYYIFLSLIYYYFLITFNDHKSFLYTFILTLIGTVLFLLSTKWTIFHVLISFLFLMIKLRKNLKSILILFMLLLQLFYPFYVLKSDGIFANSSLSGLILAMTTKSFVFIEDKKMVIVGFYEGQYIKDELNKKNSDNKFKIFKHPYYSDAAIELSKESLKNSKQVIINNFGKFLANGTKVFFKSINEFPFNYKNSGMDIARLGFDPKNTIILNFLFILTNYFFYYIVPIVSFLICWKKKYAEVIFLSFLILNYSLFSYVNLIEIGRMKIYSFSLLMFLLPSVMNLFKNFRKFKSKHSIKK